jgi:hypothetical protein
MADNVVQTVAYATLNLEQHPPTALYVAPMSTFLCSGENVILKELHSLLPQRDITTKIGRIVKSTDVGDAAVGCMQNSIG